MSNGDYNPFREEYIDPTAPDPNVDFTGFDVPYDDRGQTLSDAAGTGFATRAGCGRRHVGVRPGGSLPGELRSAGGGFTLPQTPPAGADFALPSCGRPAEFEEFVSGRRFRGGRLRRGGFGDERPGVHPFVGRSAEQQRFDDRRSVRNSPMRCRCRGGYVAALLGGRFVVVDVRRARERILYEDYLRMLGNGSSVSQQLLFPERLVLSGDEYRPAGGECRGVRCRWASTSTSAAKGPIEVRGTPADMPADAVDRLLLRPVAGLCDSGVALRCAAREDRRRDGPLRRQGVPGRTLSREEAAALLAQLADTGSFSFSPSGKAITAEITPEDLPRQVGIIRRKNSYICKN